tara:strand:+ start:238 stop:534 length:297 start_codon:yes stop_codon:yes gene_type:complete
MTVYKFKSDATKAALPTGYTDTSMVKREEVPAFLELIRKSAKKVGGDAFDMLAYCSIDGADSWNPKFIMNKASMLQKDIIALKSLLVVKENQVKEAEE